jgi:hypothetical protein
VLTGSYLFFAACLVAFMPAFAAQDHIGAARLGTVFFVWVSVFNLFVVSLFWSVMADVYRSTQARLMFPFIAFGGMAGALVGPVLTAALVARIGVPSLLLVSAAGLLVADLTSMWAGPLCGQLMASAGATVVKVESPHRPDGTRAGEPQFYDWINQGKLSYAIDFDRDAARLKALLAAADVVIEGSRPGALARRGLSPHALAGPPGRVWVRITGHGADSPRVAFGDDAAVAGGLVGASGTGPVFCGDAIADPLTGLETAVAVSDSLSRGGGELIEVVMSQVAATYAALPAESAGGCDAVAPQPPPPAPPAAGLGDDNARVDALVAQKGVTPC